jgi:hypothetical protein
MATQTQRSHASWATELRLFASGPLDGGVTLSTVYAVDAAVAAAMGLWSLVVAGRRPSPSTLHPPPG